jgi:hypothetical protein
MIWKLKLILGNKSRLKAQDKSEKKMRKKVTTIFVIFRFHQLVIFVFHA